jgi:mono/diheme cytochrome c family protein
MSRWRLPCLAILATASMFGVGWGVGRWRNTAPDKASPAPADKRGALLYQVHCASCHGADGHGDGISAAALRPPPGDFAARPWHSEPTKETIRRVTLQGVPGTAMPSFGSALSSAELDAVVAHVHDLATSGPIVEYVPTEEEHLLHDAGFTDLRGTDPPSLVVANAAGETVTLTQTRGKLTLVHFWGTGCVHCIKEIPALNDLEKAHAGRMAILHVCADEDDPAAAQKILDRLVPGAAGYSVPSGLGLARFEAQVLPTVWLIDASGKSVGRASGAKDWGSAPLKNLILRFLPRPGP